MAGYNWPKIIIGSPCAHQNYIFTPTLLVPELGTRSERILVQFRISIWTMVILHSGLLVDTLLVVLVVRKLSMCSKARNQLVSLDFSKHGKKITIPMPSLIQCKGQCKVTIFESYESSRMSHIWYCIILWRHKLLQSLLKRFWVFEQPKIYRHFILNFNLPNSFLSKPFSHISLDAYTFMPLQRGRIHFYFPIECYKLACSTIKKYLYKTLVEFYYLQE